MGGVQMHTLAFKYWYSGEEETLHTKMRSIIAQMEYTYQIRTWQSKGVPFDIYLYVPEIHPDTNATFYEQEDAVHLLKVMIGVNEKLINSYTDTVMWLHDISCFPLFLIPHSLTPHSIHILNHALKS